MLEPTYKPTTTTQQLQTSIQHSLRQRRGGSLCMNIDLGFRRRAIELVADAPDREQMIARGSTMTRGQIATFVLAETTASSAV